MSIATFESGALRTLTELADSLPAQRGRRGKLHPSTMQRWATKGITTADGQTVKLAAVRVGYRWLSSEAALAEFCEKLSAVNA